MRSPPARLPLSVLAVSLGLLAMTGMPAQAQDMVSFRSPSNNIHCLFDSWEGQVSLRCDIAEASQTYRTPPPDCDLDWGKSFYVGSRGPAGLTCHGDTVINSDAMILGYDSEITLAGITCRSAKTGISCRNADGHGFTVARAAQKIF